MSNPELSIVMPGIRVNKWIGLLESIYQSTKRTFELIIISPHPLPEELNGQVNIKYIKSFQHPNAAQQQGATNAIGKYLTWVSDDALYLPNTLDNYIDEFEKSKCHFLAAKYTEGNKIIQPNQYFYLNNAYPRIPYINQDVPILNIGLCKRELFEYYGGWDCEFEVTCLGHADLTVRVYINGDDIKLWEQILFSCEHEPDRTGSHGPVHDAQGEHDIPLYKRKYCEVNNLDHIKTKIDMDNWKNSPQVWTRRFSINA